MEYCPKYKVTYPLFKIGVFKEPICSKQHHPQSLRVVTRAPIYRKYHTGALSVLYDLILLIINLRSRYYYFHFIKE